MRLPDGHLVRIPRGAVQTRRPSGIRTPLYDDFTQNPYEFDQEADKLEQAADDPRNYYVIEKEPIICKYISVPKGIACFYNSKIIFILDKSSLNCAAFAGGIIEAVLCSGGFPAKVTTHWHKGTTFMIQFNESVIEREKQ